MLIVDQLIVRRDRLSFQYHQQIQEGEIVAIQGVSGIGKSTLLEAIAGFAQITSGDIRWLGKSFVDLIPEQRPVSMLFQDNNLFEHLSIKQNLRFIDTEVAWSEVEKHALTLGVGEQLTKQPNALSGGQRQRVALLRTLLRPEPLILLDEPFSELDPATRATAASWSRQMAQQRNKTLMAVTHHNEDVEQLADRVIRLE